MAKIIDIKTRAPEGYFEYSMIRGCEVVTCEQQDAVIQAFIGELKTNKGECHGIGQENYGSDLKRIIGDPMTTDLELEVSDCIQQKAQEYPEIWNSFVSTTLDESEGIVHIEIQLETIYGVVLETLDFVRGC